MGRVVCNGKVLYDTIEDAAAFYRSEGLQYPKFFKMDNLCKWAWLGATLLLRNEEMSGVMKETAALVLHTREGCLDVDKKFLQSTETIASPALFVYTLPNIMLGEISIAYGFKGQQTLLINDGFDAHGLYRNISLLWRNAPTTHALCGWVNVKDNVPDVCLFWVNEMPSSIIFNEANAEAIFKQ